MSEARKTADGSLTLYSDRYRQTMHSERGAVAEARHVFLEGAGVTDRLREQGDARVLEVGFGAGLNFLVTADLALALGAPLAYVALERDLLSADTLRDLEYGRFLTRPGLFGALLEARAALPAKPAPGRYVLPVTSGVRLEVRLGEATAQTLEPNTYHAVYQDAFSPDTNPELWAAGFLGMLVHALAPGGRLSSYSVQGDVRRRLSGLGCEVAKRPGPPGGKREMLVARKPPESTVRHRR
ncbi:MAG TPA: tRNA (5-methylaminomethyl-2-thiouridine)(34)-methyltransferase MnmD [Trueperaceae bacterium]